MLLIPTPTPTPSGADSIDVGNGWSLAAVLALVAGFVSFVTLVWTAISFGITRGSLTKFERESVSAKNREEFRTSIDQALTRIASSNSMTREFGLTMLQALETSSLATDDDRKLIASLLNAAARGSST